MQRNSSQPVSAACNPGTSLVHDGEANPAEEDGYPSAEVSHGATHLSQDAINPEYAELTFPSDVALIFASILRKISQGWEQGVSFWPLEVAPLVVAANAEVTQRNRKAGLMRPESHFHFLEVELRTFLYVQSDNIKRAEIAQQEQDVEAFRRASASFFNFIQLLSFQTGKWGFPVKILMNDKTKLKVINLCREYVSTFPHDAQGAKKCLDILDQAIAVSRQEAGNISQAIEEMMTAQDRTTMEVPTKRAISIREFLRLRQQAYDLPEFDGLDKAIELIYNSDNFSTAQSRPLIQGLQQVLGPISDLKHPISAA